MVTADAIFLPLCVVGAVALRMGSLQAALQTSLAIQLMLGLAERKIEPTPSVRAHLDLCLDCRGCERSRSETVSGSGLGGQKSGWGSSHYWS